MILSFKHIIHNDDLPLNGTRLVYIIDVTSGVIASSYTYIFFDRELVNEEASYFVVASISPNNVVMVL